MKRNILLGTLLVSSFCIGQNIFPATGNVGIGTNTPVAKLEVKGTIKSYEATALGDPVGSVQLLNEIGERAGAQNNIYRRLWFYRDNASSSDWLTARFHDGISVDGVFNTPQVDTRTWWERDPNDNIQSWGNANSTYLTINKGNVGIGTTDPDAKLTVNGNAKLKESLAISGVSGGYTTGDNPVLSFGTINSDFAKISVPFGDKMTLSSYHGYTFKTSYNGAVPLTALTIGITGDVGIGTINPDAKLAVNGTIHSKEVKVDMVNWPDYVFKKEYNLVPLQEVEKQIIEDGHLKDVPSAVEVEKNGIYLGEMNAKLLQKIEELTLYAIEQQKNTEKLKEIILEQNKRLDALENNKKGKR